MEPKLGVFSLEDYVSVFKPEFGRPDQFNPQVRFIIDVRVVNFGGGRLLHSSCFKL